MKEERRGKVKNERTKEEERFIMRKKRREKIMLKEKRKGKGLER